MSLKKTTASLSSWSVPEMDAILLLLLLLLFLFFCVFFFIKKKVLEGDRLSG